METIKTRAYGEIEVPENSAIHFKRGILGFEDHEDYYLLEMKDLENFYWLQSKKDSELAFIVIDPRVFVSDYVLVIDGVDWEMLEMDSKEDIIDLVIANVPDDPSQMSLNLLGPIVVNARKRIAIQAISNNTDYGTRHLVFHNQEEEITADKT